MPPEISPAVFSLGDAGFQMLLKNYSANRKNRFEFNPSGKTADRLNKRILKGNVMIHKNTILVAIVMSALMMMAWSYIADKGYDKIKPAIEKKQKQLKADNQKFKERLKENIQDLGGDPSMLDNMKLSDLPEIIKPGARPMRPIGTWMGTCKGEGTRVAMAKFDKSKYWLLLKDPVLGDITEKGKYEFLYDSIEFKPKGKSQYRADFDQVSSRSITIHIASATLMMEKTDNIKLNF